MMNKLYWKLYTKGLALGADESGDTNFVSMMLIIGVVVVLAGLFLTMGTTIMNTVTQMVTDFLNNL